MVDQRLPTVDGDDGEWGEILNQFLQKEHYDTGTNDAGNGGHKTITVRAGTTSPGTAPLKFTSGSLLTTAEAGAIEFLTDRLYFTVTTGTVRRTIAAYNDASGATGDIYYRDSSGNFTRLGIGSTNDVLKVTGGLPVWAAASGGSPGGSTTHVQYNTSGSFAGSANFVYNPSSSPNLNLTAAAASHVGLRIQGFASQSAHLQTWTDNSLNPLVAIDAFGSLVFNTDTYLYRSAAATLATTADLSIIGSKALKFEGSGSGTITIQPLAAAGTYTLTLPNNDGNANDFLQSNGSGVLSWAAAGNMNTTTYDAAGIAQQLVGLTATQTLTNKTLTSPVIATITNTGTITLPTSTDTLVGRATTDTLTNKRLTPRTGTTTSSATPSINTDNVDFYSITALAANITSFTMSGTPTDGQKLWIAITGTAARTIAWGSSFEASTNALPTTTVSTDRLDVGFVWNTATSKWRCVATA